MIGYERHSETERVLVNDEGIINLSLLKIQSDHLGNLMDKSTKPYNADFDGDKSCLQQGTAKQVVNKTCLGKRCNIHLF